MQTVNQSKNFLKSFLYHDDKLLLKFDGSNVIDPSSSDDDTNHSIEKIKTDSSDDDYNEKLIENLNNKDRLTSIFALGRLKKYLMPLVNNEKLTPFKKRLLKNFFSNLVI